MSKPEPVEEEHEPNLWWKVTVILMAIFGAACIACAYVAVWAPRSTHVQWVDTATICGTVAVLLFLAAMVTVDS